MPSTHQRPPVALFANRDSPQRDALAEILREQGAQPLAFDIQLAGDSGSRVSAGGGRAAWDGVDFAAVRAVYIRCTSPNTLPLLPPVLNQASYDELRSRYLREQECMAATYGFFEQLAGAGTLVVNPLTSAYLDHNAKAQLYQKLRGNGFPAPRTLATNDPERAARFLHAVGEAVVKPAIGVGSTRLLVEADERRLEEVRVCPVLLQERIRGDTVRVHIVGDSVVLALRILNQDNIDSRTGTQGFERVELPAEEAQRIVRANRMLGLHFAAWDIIARDDGRYVYLDCNPGPYIMWIGPQHVREVFGALATYLITFASSGSLDRCRS